MHPCTDVSCSFSLCVSSGVGLYFRLGNVSVAVTDAHIFITFIIIMLLILKVLLFPLQ